MLGWTVELAVDLHEKVKQWSLARQLETDAIRRLLASGGPEALGMANAELEGVPPWDDLSSPWSLMFPMDLPSGWRTLTMEIGAGRKIILVDLE